MLPVIGLSLDAVGAVVLVLGLFGPTRAARYDTPTRGPSDVAHDVGLGVVGALLLISGFLFQALSYFGVTRQSPTDENVAWALASLLAGSTFAWLGFGVIYIIVLKLGYPAANLVWRPSRLRFWNHEGNYVRQH